MFIKPGDLVSWDIHLLGLLTEGSGHSMFKHGDFVCWNQYTRMPFETHWREGYGMFMQADAQTGLSRVLDLQEGKLIDVYTDRLRPFRTYRQELLFP